jgi:hypothetical protein
MGVVMTVINAGSPPTSPTEEEVEGEIREFVRRDLSALRRSSDADSEMIASNIGALLQRVAGTSVEEIDKLISELQNLREMLSSEGARVQREIIQYATLSQSAMQSTKIIAESLTQWRRPPESPRTAESPRAAEAQSVDDQVASMRSRPKRTRETLIPTAPEEPPIEELPAPPEAS